MRYVVYFVDPENQVQMLGTVHTYWDYITLLGKIKHLREMETTIDWAEVFNAICSKDPTCEQNLPYVDHYRHMVYRELSGYEELAKLYFDAVTNSMARPHERLLHITPASEIESREE